MYAGGAAPELRKEVWKFLLGVYDLDSTAAGRAARSRDLVERYDRLSQQWKHIDVEQAAHWAKWRERRSQVRSRPLLSFETCFQRSMLPAVLNQPHCMRRGKKVSSRCTETVFAFLAI